ncbi:hypothetical protein AYL99_01829 [Fonsecaea erecta]|uniref:Uncharacterized protein n=1 Tax=Fonsecaea erecta TaxID=1367422 RepID=A0A178ZSG2_9EURO|nr:hypothetical protein AYL99_01829 [Fonsecaea erecta]OAP62602.1 hypothetical protein AYL99_01829 [Fonsecaea erecta]
MENAHANYVDVKPKPAQMCLFPTSMRANTTPRRRTKPRVILGRRVRQQAIPTDPSVMPFMFKLRRLIRPGLTVAFPLPYAIFTTSFAILNGAPLRSWAAPSHSDDPTTSSQRDDTGYIPSPERCEVSYDSAGHGKGKRKAREEDYSEPKSKKRAISVDRDAFTSHTNEIDFDESSSRPSRAIWTKAELDRTLMPPPSTPRNRTMSSLTLQVDPDTVHDPHTTSHDDDSISFVSTAISRRKIDSIDTDAMEEARRHAAAVTLPANSGLWSQTERELFFHLAYRGFEALLPQNWMIDFDTLPISVFAHENSVDPPLIQNLRDNQFRASHALRRLFEAGHDIRDRTHVSPGALRERILENSVKRYIYWALTDVGLRPASSTKYIPVHAVVARKKGRSTLQTLEEIANKLQRLSQRHQRAQNILPSIETDPPGFSDPTETRVVEEDASLPTLIGFVIISSVLVIVTLNSSPASTLEKQTPSPLIREPSLQGGVSVNADRLRIIAELDFSQRDQDVWNALGVAIVAMQVRTEALKVNRRSTSVELTEIGWEPMPDPDSRLEDDFERSSSVSRLHLIDDDPDL